MSSAVRSSADALARIVRRFPRVRLLVVGDLMLDRFIWGRVTRISPEAPVPVVQVTRENVHLGGAANVAANIRALGGLVQVVGVVGRDDAGVRLLDQLRSIRASVAGITVSADHPTVEKTRVLAHQQQVVRLDRERSITDENLETAVIERVRQALGYVDGVVVSDYGKGVVTPKLLALLAERDRRGHLFIDPKRGNFAHYRGATLMKPNLDAASLASGIEIDDERSLRRAGAKLVEMWRSDAVLVSRGEEGMTLFQPGGRHRDFPTAARQVFDVTGAGDTVLSTAALAIAVGASFEEAAVLANRAAGLVVGKLGTAAVSARELLADLREVRP